MKFALFIILSYTMGFLSAIPLGAVQVEVARRAVTGHLRAALMVAFGALLVDIFYGAVALFGITPFLRDERVMAVFWLAGGVLLIVLGVSVVRQGLQFHTFNPRSIRLRHKGVSFFTGVSLALTNPMMIMWWLVGGRLMEDLRLVVFTPRISLSFLAAGGLGMFSYPGLLAGTLYWLKRFIPQSIIMRLTLASGLLLLLLSFYFIVRSLLVLL
ncbi:MAG: LysE family transporter [Nitrospirae bacterium]|nr:LysE family transporter [Nitrospirota bacterium]